MKFGLPGTCNRSQLTLREGATALGLTKLKLKEIAAREDLYLVQRSGTGAPSLLRADRVAALVERKASTLTKGEAAGVLGVGHAVVVELVALGMLRQVPSLERIDYRRLLSRSEVDRLIAEVRARIVPPRGRRRLLPLTTAGGARLTIVDLLQAVLDGRVAPRGLGKGRGLGALLFDPKEVGSAAPSPVGTMSVAEAAAAMAVDDKNAHLWVRHGLLLTVGPAERERGRRVTPDGLSAFQEVFITSTKISKLVGQSSRAVSARLAALGIPAAIAEARTPIYPRSLLTGETMRRVFGD